VTFVALPTEDKSVLASSASSKSVLTDTEEQGKRRKRGRPQKFSTQPYLDDNEESQAIPTASKRGRPLKVQSTAGRPRLRSVGAENPDLEVASGESFNPDDQMTTTVVREGNKTTENFNLIALLFKLCHLSVIKSVAVRAFCALAVHCMPQQQSC
jgi:hypothetical protein